MSDPSLPQIPAERADDLHHLKDADSADLVLFMAGNQFMAVEALLAAFRRRHPAVKRIFYETLPPGLELKQILAGGARFSGRVLSVRPDVYTAVRQGAMETLVRRGHLAPGGYRPYLRNRLALMVPAGNPAKIAAVTDLAKPEVRISQPDPENEDIGRHIVRMYRDAGGEDLVRRIMEEKRTRGTARFTLVHHRETPIRIGAGAVDVGPVWATEAAYARSRGLCFDVVEPGPSLDQRDRIRYYACALKRAPHPEAAAAFVEFLLAPEAQAIFESHGFVGMGSE